MTTAQLVTPSFTSNIHKFTVQQYHLMHEAGVFAVGDRYELINGEIREMSPIGIKHAVCVTKTTRFFQITLGDRALVWAQNPILLGDYSQPQPDLAILKWRDDFYASALPTPEDILLVIEVADSTIAYDRDVKMPLYSANGIPEMWLFDVNQQIIEGYTQPSASGYKRMQRYEQGDTLSLLAFPEVVFNWEALL
ncbi:Uma2 family endonuclease [Pseudanabaena sp. FACHB-1998]|uniref:Uma2 family endonuclease n=1 Tax=Pseudanabaena sp. FACHB-1998 TaxID=2692858 RepID=UPI0016812810|nr:Uma2 family endonuclease [Pseudanabaena sp. FACHB-1998]MBD2178460.1 Uma2 family endonuclease [Pseudanabaena sp. FACHB-1998]